MKKRGLAKDKGLDLLMSAIKDDHADGTLVRLPLDNLTAGKYQPRRNMQPEALQELADSVARHGVMQPIVVRPIYGIDGVSHEIVAGERRWRAAKMANLPEIPAIERELSDEMAIALALIENIQREELTVLETAAALARFADEFGMSHAMIADALGKARATISNLLRLNQLNDAVKAHLDIGTLDMGHARAILALPDDMQAMAAQKVVDKQMTVRETERLVKTLLEPIKPTKVRANPFAKIGQDLTKKLGAPVKISQKDGKGSVQIFFDSENEMARVLGLLQGTNADFDNQ